MRATDEARRRLARERAEVLLLAADIGIVVGLACVLFKWLIFWLQTLFLGPGAWGENVVSYQALAPWHAVLLAPVVGGLAVGLLTWALARDERGDGVPKVMVAVERHGGVIPPRVALVRMASSALSLASGASVGREGPIVQIGAALGSAAGQLAALPPGRMRTAVGCGAAAGIAGTFNAPLGGALFALELIVGDFQVRHSAPVLVSSLASAAISRHVMGNTVAFALPRFALAGYGEYALYALLGLVIGLVAHAFIIAHSKAGEALDAWDAPPWLKPAIVGVGMGAALLALPQLYGVSYDSVGMMLEGRLDLSLVLVLLVAKLVATSVCLAGGFSGGTFAPSLFLGACAGSAFGSLAHAALPGATSTSGSYALVGMAAFVGAATQAPFQAIMLLFEMTGDYDCILPLMLATSVGVVVSVLLGGSVYTHGLSRRGINVHEADEMLLEGVAVGDAMEREVEAVPHGLTKGGLVQLLHRSSRSYYPVLSADGRVEGILPLGEVHRVALDPRVGGRERVLGRAHTVAAATVGPDEPLASAVHAMDASGVASLVVVDGDGRMVGILKRRDVIRAWERAALDRQAEGG